MGYYQFEFRPYERSFTPPLRTNHGVWYLRKGIILRITDTEGQVGWGEIAPIQEFGSESFEQALAYCQQIPAEVADNPAPVLLPDMPACQFGFESAWEMLTAPRSRYSLVPSTYSALLPTGSLALQAWQKLWENGARTFKWKIGVDAIAQELSLFEQLITALPSEARLRLDANGGFDWQQTCEWLRVCDPHNTVEFLEQPLPPEQFDLMLKLSEQYPVPIALDESVATTDDMEACYNQGWRGIFVIKAAIAGSPARLREFCRSHEVDVVWSSAFETAVAGHFIQHYLIASLPVSPRAIGFGVDHWFDDADLDHSDFDRLWQSL
ncbi:MAG: o-succinylbenzoate synthase [Cyanobacteria bacterium CRU_2_1]|nr:o-succinylbenzoate synthase [Cyanobacteria bacterium RU_5_0]NJR61783.1 o-succinylbenzoate synthase [Cyanobacteria bacterium CRU_2_1]